MTTRPLCRPLSRTPRPSHTPHTVRRVQLPPTFALPRSLHGRRAVAGACRRGGAPPIPPTKPPTIVNHPASTPPCDQDLPSSPLGPPVHGPLRISTLLPHALQQTRLPTVQVRHHRRLLPNGWSGGRWRVMSDNRAPPSLILRSAVGTPSRHDGAILGRYLTWSVPPGSRIIPRGVVR